MLAVMPGQPILAASLLTITQKKYTNRKERLSSHKPQHHLVPSVECSATILLASLLLGLSFLPTQLRITLMRLKELG